MRPQRPRPPAVTRVRSVQQAGLLAFLLVLVGVAFLAKEELLLYLLYAVLGLYVLGRAWARRALASVDVERRHDDHAFLWQPLPVQLHLRNRGWLPVLWLRLGEALPPELAPGNPFRQVVSLGPRERLTLSYTLQTRKRGYYPLAPVTLHGGDLLGTAAYETQRAAGGFVVVYPRIVPLLGLTLPSQSPLGTLPGRERLFDDPARIRGVRDYQPGDSLRHMDWKASARSGALKVRRLEPAIALETALVLDLDGDDYPGAERYDATELAISIAASAAVHVVEQRQAVGLATNGRDPLRLEMSGPDSSLPAGAGPAGAVLALPLRKGREHLMHVLDLLARIEVAGGEGTLPFVELVSRSSLRLPWGSTVVAVTSREGEGLMEALLGLRRRGLAVLLVLTCPGRDAGLTARRAEQIGARAVTITSERELRAWT